MKAFLLMACTVTVVSAIFFPPFGLSKFGGQPMTRLCIQSVDPSRYQPKCIFCPNSVYASVVTLCVNGTTIPSNVTYIQARCLEQNCLIRGKRSISLEAYIHNSSDVSQLNGTAYHEIDRKESTGDNNDSDTKASSEGVNVVQSEETIAGPDMLYAEWVQNSFDTNEVDGDYENFR